MTLVHNEVIMGNEFQFWEYNKIGASIASNSFFIFIKSCQPCAIQNDRTFEKAMVLSNTFLKIVEMVLGFTSKNVGQRNVMHILMQIQEYSYVNSQ